jgi:hypothetical protein
VELLWLRCGVDRVSRDPPAVDWVPGAIVAVVTLSDSTCGTLAVLLTRRPSRPGAMMAGAALYLAWAAFSALAGFWRPPQLIITTAWTGCRADT